MVENYYKYNNTVYILTITIRSIVKDIKRIFQKGESLKQKEVERERGRVELVEKLSTVTERN